MFCIFCWRYGMSVKKLLEVASLPSEHRWTLFLSICNKQKSWATWEWFLLNSTRIVVWHFCVLLLMDFLVAKSIATDLVVFLVGFAWMSQGFCLSPFILGLCFTSPYLKVCFQPKNPDPSKSGDFEDAPSMHNRFKILHFRGYQLILRDFFMAIEGYPPQYQPSSGNEASYKGSTTMIPQ